MKKTLMLFLASVVVIGGCNNSPSSVTNSENITVKNASTTTSTTKVDKRMGMLSGINLTDAQKSQIDALKKEEKPDFSDMKLKMDVLKNVIKEAFVSDSINKDDLTNKLASLRPQDDTKLDLHIANMIKIYNILTPEQRTQIEENEKTREVNFEAHIKNIDFKRPPHGYLIDKLASDLSLSEEQQTSLKILLTPPERPDPEVMKEKHKQISELVKTGDAEKIKAIMKDMHPDFNKDVEKIIAVHDLLNKEQRQKLVDLPHPLPFFGPPPHGGHPHDGFKPDDGPSDNPV